ncbi:MAG: ribonuclease P protein component [Candidatus Zambryskibacteria bacterium]|nr:ribonuclease P protein component [Candidatus Zambryskibacteria bacterium]
MTYFYLRVTPADRVTLVISVSKKISKKAVIRNRIRRRVRPILQKFISHLKPATYFIVAKPGAEEIKGEALEVELQKLLSFKAN